MIAAVVNESGEIALLREGSIAWQLVKTIIENKGDGKNGMEYLFETEHLRAGKFETEDAKCLYENHLEEEAKKWIPNESYADMESTFLLLLPDDFHIGFLHLPSHIF